MKLMIILLSTFVSTAVFAQSHGCFEADSSTIALEECQVEEFKEMDTKLINEYQVVVQQLHQSPSPENKLKIAKILQSHQDWISHREAKCVLEAAEREGGSSQGYAKAECLTRSTEAQILYVQSLQSPQVQQKPANHR